MFLDKNNYDKKDWNNVIFLNEFYEYCYMESMHYFQKQLKNTEIIITGLSYGLDDIDTGLINRPAINFSMHSQDLYYDIRHILMAISDDTNKTIKHCIFTLGYYSLFYDLSKSSNKNKCAFAYYPLFDDLHNFYNTNEKLGKISTLLKQPNFIYFYRNYFINNPSFYGPAINMEQTVSSDIFENGGWAEISQQQRWKDAEELTNHHNKHINHNETFIENVNNLREIFGFLEQSNIRIHVMVMPFSKEYCNLINPQYKSIILDTLNLFEQTINFIDFNDYDFFDEDDYLNSDHLNKNGAKKMSGILNSLL